MSIQPKAHECRCLTEVQQFKVPSRAFGIFSAILRSFLKFRAELLKAFSFIRFKQYPAIFLHSFQPLWSFKTRYKDDKLSNASQIPFKTREEKSVVSIWSHLKKIDTQTKANAADSEMYCGSAHLRWLSSLSKTSKGSDVKLLVQGKSLRQVNWIGWEGRKLLE